MLNYFLDIQLFLQSQLIPHRKHTVSQGHTKYEGLLGCSPPAPNRNLKNIDLADMMIKNVV
jgi:hypothetical protein